MAPEVTAGPPARGGDRGFSLIELVIVMGILTAVLASFYTLLVTTGRGWALLEGQLETQQQPRVATDRLVNDLQQAYDQAIAGGSLTVQKSTIVVCPVIATATTSTVLVENATDVLAASAVTMTALSGTTVPVTISTIGGTSACASNGVSGTALTIAPSVTSAISRERSRPWTAG